jgi:hypothetical protein
MKKVLTIAAVLAVLALAVSFAGAAPRFDAGSTGLVQTPTADVLGEGVFDLAVDWQDADFFTVYPIRFVYGLGKAELGIAYIPVQLDGGGDTSAWQYSGKVQLLPETATQPAVALGADYATLDLVDIDRLSIYAVATKQLSTGDGPSVRGNLGVAYDRYSNGGTESFTKPFVGLEVGVAEGTSILAEYKWGNDMFEPIFSAAVRHSFAPNLMVEAGLTNLAGIDDEKKFFAGVSYRFGAGY